METRHRNVMSTAHKCGQTSILQCLFQSSEKPRASKSPESEVEEDLLDLDGEEVQSQPEMPVQQGDEPSAKG
ncbi:hypothetical protein RB195_022954 [Necator americanus]|uniref:Uncharacterized protein n=1 Tax=Necator americanus TaxID=51031 RepID=A0ABR1EHH7_NECAM